MWDIKKLYNNNTFPNDENSLGYVLMFTKNLLIKHLKNI